MNNDQPPTVPAKVAEDQYFPPPPPGPPPGYAQQNQQTQVPQTTVPQTTTLPQTNTVPPTNPTSYPADQKTHIPPIPGTTAASNVAPTAPNVAPTTAHHGDPHKHTNDTPLPDFEVPQFTPHRTDSDLYNASPPQSPPLPPRPGSSGKHDGQKHKRDWSQKLSDWGSKAAVPVNALVNKLGSEGFLPQPLDKECEKAARILRSFAKDGIYSETTPPTAPAVSGIPTAPATGAAPPSPQQADHKTKKPKVLLTIPSKVIARAQGLAIFTTARAGFQVSGATGSGILIARLPDGTWSPPSGIQVHSVGAGFMIGLDIYDCVVVINTREALEAFTRTRLSLGSDLAVTAGPWGIGGAIDVGMPQQQKGKDKGKDKATVPPVEHQQHQPHLAPPQTDPSMPPADPDQAPALPPRKPSPFREAMKHPVYSYVKSRGFYAGVQIDGTVVTERKDANAAFYGVPVAVQNILRGEVMAQGPAGMWPDAARGLFEVLRGAEGWRGQQQQGAGGVHPGAGSAFSPPPHGAAAGFPPGGVAPAAGYGTEYRDLGGEMKNLNIGDGAGSSAGAFGGGPAPPPPMTAAEAKAAEAAAEAAKYPPQPYVAPPPTYDGPVEELPPAYVEDGQYRPPTDSKTGQH
ncbi:hypothetical protein QBC39DRAFT_363970 [Podospora conica]|nr:hypothetical protein QBC39DRAFT_363970 [Schizothecium conicum]